MKSVFLAALAFSACVITPASAVTVLGATTLAGPTYNRPLAGAPPTGLSGVGTAVHYQVTPFTVSASGSYTFLMTAILPAGWDTYLGLHSTAFLPASALTNAIVYNDDFPSIGLSGFSANLLVGVSYFAVASGFENTDVGTYSLAINGPGNVNVGGGGQGAVPEPTTWAMLLAGFGIVGSALRRRRRASAAFA